MSESDAVARMLAKGRAGQVPDPRTEDELIDDREPSDMQSADAGTDVDVETADEPAIEGDEFDGEEDAPVQTADPVVKFDDGTELPLSEVKRGFLRQSDYTRKTQEAAELRKTYEAERTQFIAERKSVADRLTPLIQQAEAIINNPATQAELNELRVTDPGAYAVRVMEMQAKQQALAQLQWQQNSLREQAEREEADRFQRERAQTAEQSRAALMDTVPAAKKDFAAWYQGLGKWVLEQGIPAEAWDNEVDHRIILMAWKAKQYDEATRKAPATNDQLRKAPQPLRPGAARPPGHAQARALREATERAHASGSMDDAVAAQLAKLRSARR
jgi:hypothetical protein